MFGGAKLFNLLQAVAPIVGTASFPIKELADEYQGLHSLQGVVEGAVACPRPLGSGEQTFILCRFCHFFILNLISLYSLVHSCKYHFCVCPPELSPFYLKTPLLSFPDLNRGPGPGQASAGLECTKKKPKRLRNISKVLIFHNRDMDAHACK